MPTTLLGEEGQTPPPPEGQQPPAAPPADGEEAPAQSVEEVEARWKHRVSQKDKAHAAAEQALRDENDRLKRQLETSRPPSGGQSDSGGGNSGDADYLREQLAQSQREVEQERQARAVEARKAKFPALAKQVGDSGSSIFGTADDATLARLNALADDDETTGSTFAPTTPRKPAPASPKPLTDMSKQELEAMLSKSVAKGEHNR